MQDEEKTIFRTLTVFMLLALLGAILILVSSLIQERGIFTSSSIAASIAAVSCLIVLQLLRIKQLFIPRIILPSVIYLLATYLIFTGTIVGIRDEAVLLYPLVVATAGLLLGKRGVVVFSLLSVLTVATAIYAEISGVIVNYIDAKTTAFDTLITAVAIYGLTFTMMYILVSILTSNLTKARSNQQDLTLANQELQSIRASLELQVQERTTAVESARKEAVAAQQMAETQTWLVTGQAQLAEKMRGDLNVTVLANNIVGHLCRYIGAQAGALFLVQGETLHLTGRYAYTERAGAKTIIPLGEGLVGQAALDNQQLILYQIPEDALLIASSLGESAPRQVLVSALEIAGRVIGVLELATLNQFTTEHQAFISLSSESIAIAFQTAQTRERMAVLLLESQRQAEELQVQEEELRSANEELRARAENMRTHP
ncbi:MAG TPA: GAF domain-containing protein [Nitrososphaera sp.]|nr:GAF domain-containing protein [Nitrososphaera sp.]